MCRGSGGGGQDDAHRLFAGGDDAVRSRAASSSRGAAHLGERFVQGGVELIEGGESGGALVLVGDLGGDAVVPSANLGSEPGRRSPRTFAGRGARRVEQQLVTPEAAETTAARGAGLGLRRWRRPGGRARRLATEVPPNFMTIIAPTLLPIAIRRTKSGGSVSAPACRSVLLKFATVSRVPPDRQAR